MSVTLGEAVEIFLKRYRKETTRLAYQNDLKHHLQNFIAPGVKMEEITGFDIDRVMGNFLELDSIKSVYTINKFIKSLHVFFNWCEKRDIIASAKFFKPDYLPTPEEDAAERTMPNEDYHALIGFYSPLAATYPAKYQRALALFLFLGDTGARRGGVAGLRWSDIDFNLLEATTTEKGDIKHIRVFGRTTASVLIQWQLIQKLAAGINPKHAYVFSEHGEKMTPPAIAQYMRRRCVDAGVNKPDTNGWGTHSLRHNLGFRLLDAKVPDVVAAKVMGISVNTYRENYIAVDKERAKQAALEVAFKYADLPKFSEKIRKINNGTENP